MAEPRIIFKKVAVALKDRTRQPALRFWKGVPVEEAEEIRRSAASSRELLHLALEVEQATRGGLHRDLKKQRELRRGLQQRLLSTQERLKDVRRIAMKNFEIATKSRVIAIERGTALVDLRKRKKMTDEHYTDLLKANQMLLDELNISAELSKEERAEQANKIAKLRKKLSAQLALAEKQQKRKGITIKTMRAGIEGHRKTSGERARGIDLLVGRITKLTSALERKSYDRDKLSSDLGLARGLLAEAKKENKELAGVISAFKNELSDETALRGRGDRTIKGLIKRQTELKKGMDNLAKLAAVAESGLKKDLADLREKWDKREKNIQRVRAFRKKKEKSMKKQIRKEKGTTREGRKLRRQMAIEKEQKEAEERKKRKAAKIERTREYDKKEFMKELREKLEERAKELEERIQKEKKPAELKPSDTEEARRLADWKLDWLKKSGMLRSTFTVDPSLRPYLSQLPATTVLAGGMPCVYPGMPMHWVNVIPQPMPVVLPAFYSSHMGAMPQRVFNPYQAYNTWCALATFGINMFAAQPHPIMQQSYATFEKLLELRAKDPENFPNVAATEMDRILNIYQQMKTNHIDVNTADPNMQENFAADMNQQRQPIADHLAAMGYSMQGAYGNRYPPISPYQMDAAVFAGWFQGYGFTHPFYYH